jgi:phosphoribosylformylglycinamidine synthase
VAEAARNVACAGAVPVGATNCLNFGNPERPEVMWQFAEAVAGIGEACRALGIPITGGNVSLYNETDGRAILPTPVIGVVGLIEDASTVLTRLVPDENLSLILLGRNHGELGGSEYLRTMHGLNGGTPPALDLGQEGALLRLLADLAARKLVRFAHDCAEGGLAVSLTECCVGGNGIGASINVPAAASDSGVDPVTATLFGESASRVVVGAMPEQVERVLTAAAECGVPAQLVGRTGGRTIRVAIAGETAFEVPVTEAEQVWASGLTAWMTGRAA